MKTETTHQTSTTNSLKSGIAGRIPLWLKIAYTLFMAVLVPVYWRDYGPSNFLYFCDVALFLTLIGIWLENALLISMAAVGILIPQMFWVVDFVAHFAGLKITGMTDYMFDSTRPLFTRGLSLFHGWLPFLLLFLVSRLGYQRRAYLAWTMVAMVLMSVCYFLMPAPGETLANPSTPVNINYVFGFSDTTPQSWMNPHLYVALFAAAMFVIVYTPAHFLLQRCFRPATAGLQR